MGDSDSRQVLIDNDWFINEKSPASVSDEHYAKVKNSMMVSGRKPLRFNICFTAYDQIVNNSSFFKKVKWQSIIVDEAHRLKNNESKLFKCLKEFNYAHSVLLTGTPLQNNLDELFNLLHFIDPKHFDCGEVEVEKIRQSMGGDDVDDSRDNVKHVAAGQLRDRISGLILRRTKADISLKIPPKIERVVKIDLTPWQRYLYKVILTKNYPALASAIDESCFITKYHYAAPKSLQSFILIDPDLSLDYDDDVIGQENSPEDSALRRLIQGSGKLLLLEQLLNRLIINGNQHRVLIFSQLVMMIDVIAEFLIAKGVDFERIDGSVAKTDRQQSIERFNDPNSETKIFLLSTLAGGLGINLASADTVILMDSQWNPHNDLQALSRAHRIGQKNSVLVLRLVCSNSVEEKVLEVGRKKLALESVVDAIHSKNKGQSRLTLKDFDEALRHGATEIVTGISFKNTENANSAEVLEDLKSKFTEAQFTKPCVNGQAFTDEVFEKLLDRNTEQFSENPLGFFYDDATNAEKSSISSVGQKTDATFWDSLLKESYQSSVQKEEENLGKGQRNVSKNIDYTEAAKLKI
ncbi:hypothetical protein GEMRC1_001270 [Eukaryota sp. GEM-RC1]